MLLSDVDSSKLKFRSLKKLLKSQIQSGVSRFEDLKCTIPNTSEESKYGFVKDTFEIDAPKGKVFSHYLTANPTESWKGGGIVDFGLGADKNTGTIYYPNEPFPRAKVGQIFYIMIKILGVKEITMAQEIVTIDDAKHMIAFSYIEGGMTAGIQEIYFEEKENKTIVTHISKFKGVSSLRDKFYPYFHSKIVSQFHKNMNNSLLNLKF